MVDLLFGQSYYLKFDQKLWEAMQPYPPLGTLYAASFLRSHGYSVGLFDAMLASSEEEWALALDQQRPRFAVIYEDNFNYLSKMCLGRMRQAAFTMISMARQRNCQVIVAGSDASDHSEQYLAQGAHYVVRGEGEITLRELLDRLTGKTNQPPEMIPGLSFIRKDGDQVFTPHRMDIKDLDSLPFPAWDLVDVSKYKEIWYKRHGYYSISVSTTRGCPFHCNWCAKPIWGQRYNMRSPENVVSELKWLKENIHPDHIWYTDDIMGLKPGWLEHFADLVEQNNVNIPFKSLHRVDLLLKPGTADALRRAGAQIVWVGAESGSQKILDAMDKGTQIQQIYQAAQLLQSTGIKIGFFLQFGYPGEERSDVEKTIQMVRDCQPDDIGISVSYPLPGTKFYEAIRLQLGDKQNWVDSQDLAMMYQGPFSTAFYRKLHVVIHKEYRMRKTWKELKSGLPASYLFNPRLLRKVLAMVYQRLSLPFDLLQLNRLGGQPHQAVSPLPLTMNPEDAAKPTPQSERFQ
ncbi:MAG: radical SAM protein [Anaerolineaceae bacterium]|nr:radical SAM protein [Anaerolineaceae bacterium]